MTKVLKNETLQKNLSVTSRRVISIYVVGKSPSGILKEAHFFLQQGRCLGINSLQANIYTLNC